MLKIPQAGSFPAPQTMKAAAGERSVSRVEKDAANCHLGSSQLAVLWWIQAEERVAHCHRFSKETFLLHLSALNYTNMNILSLFCCQSNNGHIPVCPKTWLVVFSSVWNVSRRHLGPILLPCVLENSKPARNHRRLVLPFTKKENKTPVCVFVVLLGLLLWQAEG